MKGQMKLRIPERVEIIQMADVKGCYEVACDMADGKIEFLNPPGYYFAGLRPAVQSARERWGNTAIYLSRYPKRGHRAMIEIGSRNARTTSEESTP